MEKGPRAYKGLFLVLGRLNPEVIPRIPEVIGQIPEVIPRFPEVIPPNPKVIGSEIRQKPDLIGVPGPGGDSSDSGGSGHRFPALPRTPRAGNPRQPGGPPPGKDPPPVPVKTARGPRRRRAVALQAPPGGTCIHPKNAIQGVHHPSLRLPQPHRPGGTPGQNRPPVKHAAAADTVAPSTAGGPE